MHTYTDVSECSVDIIEFTNDETIIEFTMHRMHDVHRVYDAIES